MAGLGVFATGRSDKNDNKNADSHNRRLWRAQVCELPFPERDAFDNPVWRSTGSDRSAV
jgi:hypothetical protein